jgi:hypothetical protein
MAHLIGRGCADCNGDIAAAEVRMALAPGYCNADMYRNIPLPRPQILLDGEDMTGREVVAISTTLGLLTRNHLRRMPDGTRAAHLCECESSYVEMELWEGRVTLNVRPLARFIGGSG